MFDDVKGCRLLAVLRWLHFSIFVPFCLCCFENSEPIVSSIGCVVCPLAMMAVTHRARYIFFAKGHQKVGKHRFQIFLVLKKPIAHKNRSSDP